MKITFRGNTKYHDYDNVFHRGIRAIDIDSSYDSADRQGPYETEISDLEAAHKSLGSPPMTYVTKTLPYSGKPVRRIVDILMYPVKSNFIRNSVFGCVLNKFAKDLPENGWTINI